MNTGIIYSCKLGSSPSLNHGYSLNSLLKHRWKFYVKMHKSLNMKTETTRPIDFSNIGSPLFLDFPH